jgi:hypothetical protein
MHKPLNRSDSQKLPHGSYTFSADAAFLAHTSENDLITGVIGARVGDIVVVSMADAQAVTSGLVYSGHVRTDQTIEITCLNATAVAINRPSTKVNFVVIPK